MKYVLDALEKRSAGIITSWGRERRRTKRLVINGGKNEELAYAIGRGDRQPALKLEYFTANL